MPFDDGRDTARLLLLDLAADVLDVSADLAALAAGIRRLEEVSWQSPAAAVFRFLVADLVGSAEILAADARAVSEAARRTGLAA